jgi:hypothetical protein
VYEIVCGDDEAGAVEPAPMEQDPKEWGNVETEAAVDYGDDIPF